MQVEFLAGLSGPQISIQQILAALQSGTLYQLANLGPVRGRGVPGVSQQQLASTIRGLLAGADPAIPLVGPVKPLLVDHRVLGMLAGPDRARLTNSWLAARLAGYLAATSSELVVRAGESVLAASLPALQLGSPCTADILLHSARTAATVTRSSRLTATAGLTAQSHGPPSLDLLATARLYTRMRVTGGLTAKFGARLFGRCVQKFSGHSPLEAAGRAMVTARVRVVVTRVRLEIRPVGESVVAAHLPSTVSPDTKLPHLVFSFKLKLEGTVRSMQVQGYLTGV